MKLIVSNVKVINYIFRSNLYPYITIYTLEFHIFVKLMVIVYLEISPCFFKNIQGFRIIQPVFLIVD